MCICTANTFIATSWWSEHLSEVSFICGMKSSVWTSWPQSSTKCACSPRPWMRLLMASLGCLFSSKRLKHICIDRNWAVRRHESRKRGKKPLNCTVRCFGNEFLTRKFGIRLKEDGDSSRIAAKKKRKRICPLYFYFYSNGAFKYSITLTVQHLLLRKTWTLDEIQGHVTEAMNIMWYYVASVAITLTNGCAFPLKCL